MANFKPATTVQHMLNTSKLVVFGVSDCQDFEFIKDLLLSMGATFTSYELDIMEHGEEILDFLEELTGTRSLPMVFASNEFIGGVEDIRRKFIEGELFKLLYPPSGHF